MLANKAFKIIRTHNLAKIFTIYLYARLRIASHVCIQCIVYKITCPIQKNSFTVSWIEH